MAHELDFPTLPVKSSEDSSKFSAMFSSLLQDLLIMALTRLLSPILRQIKVNDSTEHNSNGSEAARTEHSTSEHSGEGFKNSYI